MGTEVGMEDAPVIPPEGLDWARKALQEDPTAFEFAQAVRILERLSREGRSPGHFVDPEEEVVRFSANPSMAFPASHIQGLRLPSDGKGPARMTVNFFGLIGPSGVLPYEYTRLVAERVRARDGAMAAFLDIFNHRAVSLLYRALRANRFDLSRERGEKDRLQAHVLDLIGDGTAAPPPDTEAPLSPGLLSAFAGLLGPQRRSASALEQLVCGAFGVEAEVQQFIGGWFPIEDRDRCALGEEDDDARLGMGAVAGDEAWDPQARVRIRMGPLAWEEYRTFLPGGRNHAPLKAITRLFSEDQFDFEVQLILRREDVPGCTPGSEDVTHQLGWSTWIRTRPPETDVEDTVFLL
jgi:type VI secretion system protein ImpH